MALPGRFLHGPLRTLAHIGGIENTPRSVQGAYKLLSDAFEDERLPYDLEGEIQRRILGSPMPAKAKFAVLCDGAMIVHGKWTIQGIFDRLYASSFPAVIPESDLAFQFSGPVGPHVIRIEFTDAKGEQVRKPHRQLVECREFMENRVKITLKNLGIPHPGFFTFKLCLDEETIPFAEVELQAMVPPGLDSTGSER